MSLKSSAYRYGSMAAAIHWTTAIAILAMLGTGLAATNTADAALELVLVRVHAVVGALVGVLTLFRILWWVAFDKRPSDHPDLTRFQKTASHIVHYGLYAVILIMVASGVGTVMLSGGPAQLLGPEPLPLPDFTLVPPFTVHGTLARLLIVLLIGHIGAALWHQFVRRDRLLARMGVG
ncbi:MAG TPA: cytochrome b/b6 domain-containing protein [Devosia sp.]|jgi:cytochrome b561|nr:cytochrome b/b6 domain-containing protein [Devosia sp.]